MLWLGVACSGLFWFVLVCACGLDTWTKSFLRHVHLLCRKSARKRLCVLYICQELGSVIQLDTDKRVVCKYYPVHSSRPCYALLELSKEIEILRPSQQCGKPNFKNPITYHNLLPRYQLAHLRLTSIESIFLWTRCVGTKSLGQNWKINFKQTNKKIGGQWKNLQRYSINHLKIGKRSVAISAFHPRNLCFCNHQLQILQSKVFLRCLPGSDIWKKKHPTAVRDTQHRGKPQRS